MADLVDPTERRWSRSVLTLLVSVTCNSMAMLAQTTALGKQVFDLTDSELALGLLGLAEFAPGLALLLLTGALADRFDRRRLGAAALVGQAATSAALAWYATTSPTSSVPIFLLVFGFGVARAFASPALRALPADVVAPAHLPWLVVRRAATWQVAVIVGPVAGGLLYTVDVALPFVFAAIASIVGATAVLATRLHPTARAEEVELDVAAVVAAATEEAGIEAVEGHGAPDAPPRRGAWHEALEGLRLVRREPVLLGAISLDLFAVLLGGAIALLPAIAEERLGVGAVGLGWLRAATGIGAAIVTIWLAVAPLRRRVGVVLLVAVATFGVATIVLGLTTSFAVAFAALVVAAGADAVSVFIRSTLVPLVTPRGMRGRVMAVETVFIGGSNELGAFESGVTGQLLGPAGAVVLGGVGTLVVVGVWWTQFPALREVDEFPGLEA